MLPFASRNTPFLAVLFSCFLLSYASSLVLENVPLGETTHIHGMLVYDVGTDHEPDTRIVLNHNMIQTSTLGSSGQFQLHDIPPGRYILDVLSVKYAFPSIYLEITKTISDSRNTTVWHVAAYKYNPRTCKLPGVDSCVSHHEVTVEKQESLSLPLVLMGSYALLQNKTTPNIFKFLTNPFLLPAVLFIFIFWGMSWVQSNENPDELKSLLESFGGSEAHTEEKYSSSFLTTLNTILPKTRER